MKRQMNTAVLGLVALNLVATCAVFVLAYAAGASAAGTMPWKLGALRSGTLYLLLCAAAALVTGSLFVFFRLSNVVCAPVKALTEFAEQLSDGNFDVRLKEVGGGTFGYINLHLNEAAARAAKAGKIDEVERLQSSATEFLKVMMQTASGDLTARGAAGEDALGKVIDAVNRALDEFSSVLRRVGEAAGEVSATANQMLHASETIAAEASQQEHEIGDAFVSLNQLAASTRQVSSHAESSAAATRSALDAIEQGYRAILEALQGLQRIRSSVQLAADRSKSLGGRSLEMQEALSGINDLLDQIHLLSLNATIGAARGGDSGRGFGPIAEELRTLTEQSRKAGHDIAALVKAMQSENSEAVLAIEEGSREVEAGAGLAEQAGQALQAISNAVRQSAGMLEQISAVGKQQERGIDAVAKPMQIVCNITRNNSLSAQEAARNMGTIVKASEELDQAVSKFKLPPAQAQCGAPAAAARS